MILRPADRIVAIIHLRIDMLTRIIHGHRGSAEICMVVYTSVAWLQVFYGCGQKAPLPPLADRVVMGSGSGAKGVGTDVPDAVLT